MRALRARLAVHYQGANSTPGYHCANRTQVNGRGVWCLSMGGVQIDQAVSAAFLAPVRPAGVRAAGAVAEALEALRSGQVCVVLPVITTKTPSDSLSAAGHFPGSPVIGKLAPDPRRVGSE